MQRHVGKGGIIVLQVLTTEASAYRLEQLMLTKFELYRCAKHVVPEGLEGRTEFVIINPRNCALRFEQLMPLAADPDAAERHVDFAMGIAADEHERLLAA